MDSDVQLKTQNKLCQSIKQEKFINMMPNKNLLFIDLLAQHAVQTSVYALLVNVCSCRHGKRMKHRELSIVPSRWLLMFSLNVRVRGEHLRAREEV